MLYHLTFARGHRLLSCAFVDHDTQYFPVQSTSGSFFRTSRSCYHNPSYEAHRHDNPRSVLVHFTVQPSELIFPDYVLQLREHCKPGQPASNAEELEHYLDLAGYWQDQCRQAQEECQRLRTINIRLERSNHTLTQRTSSSSPGPASTASKRKAAASPIRSSKRPKASGEQTVAQTQEAIENDYDFLERLGDGGMLRCYALVAIYG
jgi:hypothetical protein